MINELIKLSTHLDKMGHYREANYLDEAIKKFARWSAFKSMALGLSCGAKRVGVRFNFPVGGETIDPKQHSKIDREKWECMLREGFSFDDPVVGATGGPFLKFINIRVGVSCVGGYEVNRKQAEERREAAVDFIYEFVKEYEISGPSGLIYSRDKVDNHTDVKYEKDHRCPGDRTQYGEMVPKDAHDEWFREYQYVTISIDAPPEPPAPPRPELDYVAMANAFVEATLRTKAPNYGQGPFGTVITIDRQVYDILNDGVDTTGKTGGIRDKEDFEKFDAMVRKLTNGMSFRDVACDRLEIRGRKIGWPEIGEGTEIDGLLKAWGLPPILC